MADKIYIGNWKEIQTQNGSFIALSFSKDDLNKMIENLNDKGWVNLNLNKRKEESKYWHTHSITVNDYKPREEVQDDAPEFKTGSYGKVKKEEELNILDIPF